MDAAQHNPRRLEDLLDILQEKELHLRTPLEELELMEAAPPEAAPGTAPESWEGLVKLAGYSGPLDPQLVEEAESAAHAPTSVAGGDAAATAASVDLEGTLESRLPQDEDDEDLLAFLPDYESDGD